MSTFEEDLKHLKSRPFFLMAGVDNEDDCHTLMTAIFRAFLEQKSLGNHFPAIIELFEKGLIRIQGVDDGFKIEVCHPSKAPQLRRNMVY